MVKATKRNTSNAEMAFDFSKIPVSEKVLQRIRDSTLSGKLSANF